MHSCKKSAHEDADLPSSPAPVNIVSRTLPGNLPAAEPARTADLPSPTVSDPTAAATVCALALLSALPVPDGGTRHDSAAMTLPRTVLSECCSPSGTAHKQAFVHPAVTAPALAATPADLASHSADVLKAEPTVQLAPTVVPSRPKLTARPYTRFYSSYCWSLTFLTLPPWGRLLINAPAEPPAGLNGPAGRCQQ